MAESTPKVRPKYRVGFVGGFAIVGSALVLDGMGLFFMLTGIGEIVTELIGLAGSLLFFVWFAVLGARFFTGKVGQKVGILAASSLIEVIPFLNGLSPTFTIETVSLIATLRKEDREKSENETRERATQFSVA